MPLSLTALIVANLIPLAGALFFGWSAGSILVLYWAENVIIGGYTVLKFWSVPRAEGENSLLPRVLVSVFFCFHYGIFMLVHGVFTLMIAASGEGSGRAVDDGPAAILTYLGDGGVGYALIGLVLSHGVSFVTNFWIGGERRRVGIGQLITQPYARLIVMHVAVLVGGFGLTLVGSPAPALAALVVLKVGLDVRSHRRERQLVVT